jgi:hypothetical protein
MKYAGDRFCPMAGVSDPETKQKGRVLSSF